MRRRVPRAHLHLPSLLQRDNVIVSLPFSYREEDFGRGLRSARAALIYCFCCQVVNAFGFFGGFSTFHLPMSLFRAPRRKAHARLHAAAETCVRTPAAQTSSRTPAAACSSPL